MYNNYIQDHISTLLNKCTKDVEGLLQRLDILRFHLPYVIKLNSETNIAKPLNREYKPLGVYNIGRAVDYSAITLYDINTSELEFEFYPEEIYLYNDDTAPWKCKANFEIYKNKLAKLYKLENV